MKERERPPSNPALDKELMEAARLDTPEQFQARIEAGMPVDHDFFNDPASLLGICAHLGHAEKVKALLDAGADPDFNGSGKEPPLMLCSDISCARLLLRAGADPWPHMQEGARKVWPDKTHVRDKAWVDAMRFWHTKKLGSVAWVDQETVRMAAEVASEGRLRVKKSGGQRFGRWSGTTGGEIAKWLARNWELVDVVEEPLQRSGAWLWRVRGALEAQLLSGDTEVEFESVSPGEASEAARNRRFAKEAEAEIRKPDAQVASDRKAKWRKPGGPI